MAQPLPSKENALFRQVVQAYESKQYKKGIKAADQILKKHPSHGDTQAMKALIMNSQGKTDEAFDLCKIALKNSMKSHVCWHVYGLLYRSVKNYEEATKAYKFALRLEPDSPQIQRDLALLQCQTRDYQGFIQSRKVQMNARPQLRQNWTALAVAHHLAGELDAAEKVLTTYEGTLKNPPPRSDMEHQEASLYKNTIIAESGDYQRALEHLDSIYKANPDRTAVMELKAQYLLRVDRKSDAEAAYRALLVRNSENRSYYDGLEKSLGLDRQDPASRDQLVSLYQSYADKSDRTDAPRRIPLDFIEGDTFRDAADTYLRRVFKRRVPSAFANIKALYVDPEKLKTIQDLVHSYESESGTNGTNENETDEDKVALWKISVNYFLAQHYNFHICRDLTKAMDYINKTIELNPEPSDYTYHYTKARIYKHQGDLAKASQAMDDARKMDLADRYINTKCAKYQLRNNENEAAIQTMGLFTRKEANGGPLGDLIDMQCMWYIFEDGQAYFRQGKLSLALKRFKTIYDIFDVWQEDQFDFHSFSIRKGQIRAYIDMIRWEDKLRAHPFYSRAAYSAIKLYTMLFDKPELAQGAVDGMTDAEKKKAAKKAKKEQDKLEADKKAAAAAKATATGESETKKEDSDPQGLELLATKDPLGEAMKYLTPLLEYSPLNVDSQFAGFDVYSRRKLYLPALKCLSSASKMDADSADLRERIATFRKTLDTLPEPLPEKIDEAIKAELQKLP